MFCSSGGICWLTTLAFSVSLDLHPGQSHCKSIRGVFPGFFVSDLHSCKYRKQNVWPSELLGWHWGAFLLQHRLLHNTHWMIKHSHQNEHNLISKPTRFSCLLCLKFGLTHKWQVCQWDFSVLIKVTPKPSFLDFSFWFVFRLIHAFSSPWPSFGSLTFALGGAAAPPAI